MRKFNILMPKEGDIFSRFRQQLRSTKQENERQAQERLRAIEQAKKNEEHRYQRERELEKKRNDEYSRKISALKFPYDRQVDKGVRDTLQVFGQEKFGRNILGFKNYKIYKPRICAWWLVTGQERFDGSPVMIQDGPGRGEVDHYTSPSDVTFGYEVAINFEIPTGYQNFRIGDSVQVTATGFHIKGSNSYDVPFNIAAIQEAFIDPYNYPTIIVNEPIFK